MRLPFLRRSKSESTNRKIFRAALIIGILGLVARGASTVKELIVARAFGRSDALDAFLIAFLLPSFVVGIAMSSLASALVPTFVETRQNKGLEASQNLLSSTLIIVMLALIVIALFLGLLAPYYLPYLGSSFPAAKLRLTRELLYLLLPFVIFNGIATCAATILNAEEKFAIPSLAPLITALLTILFIEIGAGRWGVFALCAGVVGGSFLEAALLIQALRSRGIRLRLRWNGFEPGVRRVLGQYTHMLAAAILMGGTSVVDQSMAAMLPGGSVAALGYANRIVSVAMGVGAGALSTAVLPYFSSMVAQNDWNGCRHTLKRYSIMVSSIAVPLTLCLMVFSKPLVRLLYQRGAFTSADTELVSWVQICYAIQIPFFVLGTLFVRFLSSVQRSHVLLYSAGINLVLDIVLNIILMRRWGVAGIALSTSIFFIVSFLFVSIYSVNLLARQSFSALVARPEQSAMR
ncbi:MAG: polysaccharide biosynthesis C-terminal domain-containing protein [Acidobacteriia bacterium]|nr:polysaccharide biosynthesis C-terminal domain-containing protein [Terriglobia bacterium]